MCFFISDFVHLWADLGLNQDSEKSHLSPTKCSPVQNNSTAFPQSPIGPLLSRGAIDFIKRTCGAHYRMMTASWEVNKKSIWNYIRASTGWGEAGYRAPPRHPVRKRGKDFVPQEFLVGTKQDEGIEGSAGLDHGFVCQYEIDKERMRLRLTCGPTKQTVLLWVFGCSLRSLDVALSGQEDVQ